MRKRKVSSIAVLCCAMFAVEAHAQLIDERCEGEKFLKHIGASDVVTLTFAQANSVFAGRTDCEFAACRKDCVYSEMIMRRNAIGVAFEEVIDESGIARDDPRVRPLIDKVNLARETDEKKLKPLDLLDCLRGGYTFKMEGTLLKTPTFTKIRFPDRTHQPVLKKRGPQPPANMSFASEDIWNNLSPDQQLELGYILSENGGTKYLNELADAPGAPEKIRKMLKSSNVADSTPQRMSPEEEVKNAIALAKEQCGPKKSEEEYLEDAKLFILKVAPELKR